MAHADNHVLIIRPMSKSKRINKFSGHKRRAVNKLFINVRGAAFSRIYMQHVQPV